MAADLIMPTLPGDQSRHFFQQRPQHQRTRSYQIPMGPQISPLSTSISANNSPDSSNPGSPKAFHNRSARPVYMPAALRPNMFPSRCAKPKTIDDGASATSSDSESTLRRFNSSIMNLPGMAVFGHRLTRTSTGDSSLSSIDGDFDLDSFPEVTALPSRKHWKPDAESSVCDDPTCKRHFSYFTRRHHCRKCGNIFCDWHSNFAAPLDQEARFNPRASPSRTCAHCFEEFKSWYSRNTTQASSDVSSAYPHTTPSTPITMGPGEDLALPVGPEVAASVPRDWNWSTF